jgi:phosphate transport system protein
MSTQRTAATTPDLSAEQVLELTIRGCTAAKTAAEALTRAFEKSSLAEVEIVKKQEEQLDSLDHDINDGVTHLVTQPASEKEARELLACLKFIIELERIGDLLWNVAHRFSAVHSRLDELDVRDLAAMSSQVGKMLSLVTEAFTRRDIPMALQVLRDDAEVDRLRNLMFIRHVENPEKHPVRESYHLVFMSQALERAGDHAKNLAEEICHLVSGRSVRHILREYDTPVELLKLKSRGKKDPKK